MATGSFPGRIARLWPALLYLGAVVLMVLDHRGDPFDPSLTGTSRYGHNHDGALPQIAALAAVELMIVYVVLAPGSPARSLSRAAAALLLFAPWSVFSLLMSMHAGGVVVLHALWLLAVDVGIVIVLVARIVARLRQRGTSSASAR